MSECSVGVSYDDPSSKRIFFNANVFLMGACRSCYNSVIIYVCMRHVERAFMYMVPLTLNLFNRKAAREQCDDAFCAFCAFILEQKRTTSLDYR